MTSSTISSDNREFYELFTRLNHTELYQLARRNGFVVFPNLSKDALIRILIGEDSPPPINHDIDEWRLAIMTFVIEHRKVLETQLNCPARSFEPTACFGCVDTQVVHCTLSNGNDNFRRIEAHKNALVALRRKTPKET